MKNENYISHYSSINAFSFINKYTILFSTLSLFSSIYYNNKGVPYSHFFWTADISLLASLLLYRALLRPFIYKGIIKAYYPRNDYSEGYNSIVKFYLAITLTALFRVVPYVFGKWDLLPKLNPLALLIVTVFCGYIFFLGFYEDRYIDVETYSKGVNYLLQSGIDNKEFFAGKRFMAEYNEYKVKNSNPTFNYYFKDNSDNVTNKKKEALDKIKEDQLLYEILKPTINKHINPIDLVEKEKDISIKLKEKDSEPLRRNLREVVDENK